MAAATTESSAAVTARSMLGELRAGPQQGTDQLQLAVPMRQTATE
jgi:hypothetical protein